MTARRIWLTNVVIWTVIAFAAMALRLLDRIVSGNVISLGWITADVWLVALWAVATPFILRSAKRLPVRAPCIAAHAGIHLVLGSGFVIFANVAIRLPLLLHGGVRGLFVDTMLGIARYYPGAMICYGVIVAIGHRLFAESVAGDERSVEADDTRLVVREWNRVHFVALDDIDWIEAANNHVVVHTAARVFKGRERISDVEARLDARRFVRVHRSAIVHLPKIREVQPLTRGDHAVVLRSGKVVRVARSRRQALEQALGTPL